MAELIDKGALVEELEDMVYNRQNADELYCEVKNLVHVMPTVTESEIRAKAIEEFSERVKSYVDCGHLCSPTELRWSDLTIETMIDTIAEQLKEE